MVPRERGALQKPRRRGGYMGGQAQQKPGSAPHLHAKHGEEVRCGCESSHHDSSAVEVAPSRVLESEGFVHIYRRKRVAAEGVAEATTEEDTEDVVESL